VGLVPVSGATGVHQMNRDRLAATGNPRLLRRPRLHDADCFCLSASPRCHNCQPPDWTANRHFGHHVRPRRSHPTRAPGCHCPTAGPIPAGCADRPHGRHGHLPRIQRDHPTPGVGALRAGAVHPGAVAELPRNHSARDHHRRQRPAHRGPRLDFFGWRFDQPRHGERIRALRSRARRGAERTTGHPVRTPPPRSARPPVSSGRPTPPTHSPTPTTTRPTASSTSILSAPSPTPGKPSCSPSVSSPR